MDTATATVEQPIVETQTPEVPEAPLSIADHAAQFGPQADKTQEPEGNPADATDAQRPGETAVQAQQRRDKATGQYREGKVRHRAKSQQAGAEDVPRIRELTAKHRAAEEKAAQLEARIAEYERAKQTPEAPARPAPTIQPQPQIVGNSSDPSDPEPQEADERYTNDWAQFMKDRTDWAAREQWRRMEMQRQQAQFHQQRQQTWNQRAQPLMQKYPDYQQVAFQPIAPDLQQRGWRPGSVIDAFIMDDDNGPEILYHLQSHRQEVDELLSKSPLAQAKALTLLSQRFSSSSPEAAGTNGAAPSVKPVVLPPKPPTPLRTEAQRATPTPPATDGSLSIADHARHFGPKRR